MKRILHKFIASAIMLIALQITLTAQPIGSQIKTDTSGHISYWNGVDAWIPIAPGLPGQTLKFTAGVPSWVNNPNGITTTAVSNVTGTTAVSGGNILSDGGAKITAKGVCWSTSPNPTIADNKTIDGSGIGSFTSNISGLNSGATYYMRAYATNSNGTAYGNEVNISLIYKVYDIDGNAYDTVHIGTQVWLKQNLNVTHYRNGDPISNITNNATWNTTTAGAYCNYNNDINIGNIYGKLYNWYTTVDSRNLCPLGWKVPTVNEWNTLFNYVGGLSIAGGKLKEVGTLHWNSPNTGATDDFGFKALAGGERGDIGFWEFKNYANWWRYDPLFNNNTGELYDGLMHNYSSTGLFFVEKNSGLNVRCIKQ